MDFLEGPVSADLPFPDDSRWSRSRFRGGPILLPDARAVFSLFRDRPLWVHPNR